MVQTTDVVILGGGPGGLSAAETLALHGLEVTVINDGHLMGYGIEGAFKSKAQYEIARQFSHVTVRHDVFDTLSTPTFGSVARSISRAAE
ncbi:FAD-dependent oxidoreductase, partial [Alphaproteobacteria bacterium]|nr:FAD-dependent oxidoreductase [Alphaproteobacteria bacterium]